VAATLASVPAGQASDQRGATRVLTIGVALFLIAYIGFAVPSPNLFVLVGSFVAAGMSIGCFET
jgi:MFS family permease